MVVSWVCEATACYPHTKEASSVLLHFVNFLLFFLNSYHNHPSKIEVNQVHGEYDKCP